MNKEKNSRFFWLKSAYGPKADEVLALLGPAQDQISSAVDHFYRKVLEIPAAHTIFENVALEEFQYQQTTQSEYLSIILSPGVTLDQHRQMALKAGYYHCFVGVSTELLTEAFVLYTDIANRLSSGRPNEEALKDIIFRRLQFDVITQIEAYASVQYNRLEVYNHISRQKDRTTTLDLMQAVLKMLLKSFNKDLAGVAFGSVRNGNYRHLLSQGRVPFGPGGENKYPTVKIRKVEEAWFQERSFVRNHIHDDAEEMGSLEYACIEKGIRSFGFFILHDLQNVPKAYLLVCGNYPGYFADKSMRYYWNHLADLVGSNFDMIERSRAKRLSRLADGVMYRQLLARQQVNMHYQPIVDPSTGRTVKVEALARLEDGEKMYSPGLFLPMFGGSQLRDLFEIGVEQVLKGLSSIGPEPPLCSINLPPEVMLDLDWLTELPDYLLNAGATPDRICLEILETSLHDIPEVMNRIFQLREAGYAIFLDDVGAGESSLLRLVNLPVSGIKIDQSFVRSLPHSCENIDVILSLRFLALHRGLECVAEGVENTDIVDTLYHMNKGPVLFQGYAYAKPMPLSGLAQWMARDSERRPESEDPQTLFGWYAGHVGRLFTIRNAFYSIPDLLSIESLQDAERCPLHENIRQIGGSPEIEKAHREWHEKYARFVKLIQAGSTAQELWQDIERSNRQLRSLIKQTTSK